jgi:hypothetical protein
MGERRTYVRYIVWFPVTLRAGDAQVGTICRDASSGGLLVSSPALLDAQLAVTCSFRLSPDATEDVAIAGRILRADPNVDDLGLVFPYRLAIAFDPPRPDIEELLRHAETRLREAR